MTATSEQTMQKHPLQLYAHPFSTFCQKVLVALYENGTIFAYRNLEQAGAAAELAALWPLKRFPVLCDRGRTVIEASSIIEYLDLYHPGPLRMLPVDPRAALETRTMDRFFDNYVATPLQKVVLNALRAEDLRDRHGVTEAKAMLDTAYGWLDRVMADRPWAAGDDFGMADCAAAPSLFYADWVHRIDPSFSHVRAYRRRLLVRPSFAQAVDEARPYRSCFPLGAPDRD